MRESESERNTSNHEERSRRANDRPHVAKDAPGSASARQSDEEADHDAGNHLGGSDDYS
jgi:hypothetical protein